MNTKQLLIDVAKAVLRTLVDDGYWKTYSDSVWTPVDNPLRGLKVGDVVYAYYSDEEAIAEVPVIAVKDGIGYFLAEGSRPELWPVTEDSYSTTIPGLIELERERICQDIVWIEGMHERSSKLKAMYEEYL